MFGLISLYIIPEFDWNVFLPWLDLFRHVVKASFLWSRPWFFHFMTNNYRIMDVVVRLTSEVMYLEDIVYGN